MNRTVSLHLPYVDISCAAVCFVYPRQCFFPPLITCPPALQVVPAKPPFCDGLLGTSQSKPTSTYLVAAAARIALILYLCPSIFCSGTGPVWELEERDIAVGQLVSRSSNERLLGAPGKRLFLQLAC